MTTEEYYDITEDQYLDSCIARARDYLAIEDGVDYVPSDRACKLVREMYRRLTISGLRPDSTVGANGMISVFYDYEY